VANFQQERQLIPDKPGVYKYLNKSGDIIYVGKAKNLKKRLSSYFVASRRLDNKTYTMIQKAKTIEWTIVMSEIEALTLEYSYIQKYKPHYNILYTDDKSYPYLAINYNDDFPRVFITRNKRQTNIKYFGPFTQIWAIRQTLNNVTDILPLRTCTKGVFQGAKISDRPCLLGFIGKCLAPCVNKVSQKDYYKVLDDFSQFMYGNTKGIKSKLKQAMNEASWKQEFEQAAIYKKKLDALDIVLAKNSAAISDSVTADFLAITSDELNACIYAFYVSHGSIIGEQKWFIIKNLIDKNQTVLENILFDLYSSTKYIPSKIFVNLTLPDMTLQNYLSGKTFKKVTIQTPKKGKTLALLDKALQNAKENLATQKQSRLINIANRTEALQEISQALNMAKAPFRIECYDISHTGGNYRTGSMVVFNDGLAVKGQYRQFNIKNNLDGAKDDTHAIEEVLQRRLANIGKSPDKSLNTKPDLIIIDGGIPQVNSAALALRKSGIDNIALCSLAKRLEEIFVPFSNQPIILSRNSNGLYLLQQLRDESHRFAITKHRARRTKGLFAKSSQTSHIYSELKNKIKNKQTVRNK
jgi:excinuclease ABC subunit C